MAYVYVLQLEDNKYYIGKTTNPQFRLENHYTASGSAWTKKYSPIRVHEIRPDQTDHDEQRITQEYMEKYGIDNVRGGPWCQIDISKERVMIQKILNSSSDKCYQCGESGHFVKDCPKNDVKKLSTMNNTNSFKNKNLCNRCGRTGHNELQCFAKTYQNGKPILDCEEDVWSCQYCNREFDSEKGCIFHENVHCTKRKLNKKFNQSNCLVDELYFTDSDEDDLIICYRCGREGHYANKCYAKTHSKGYKIY